LIGQWANGFGTAPSSVDSRGGDYYLATTGDFYLATSEDFFMATGRR